MITKLIATAVLVAGAASVAAPANAAETRVATHAQLRVMPGVADAVFEDGDPIRVCWGSYTDTRVADGVMHHVVVELKAVSDGAKWEKAWAYRVTPNHLTCTIGVLHGDVDFKIRARVVPTKQALGSVSQVLVAQMES